MEINSPIIQANFVAFQVISQTRVELCGKFNARSISLVLEAAWKREKQQVFFHPAGRHANTEASALLDREICQISFSATHSFSLSSGQP